MALTLKDFLTSKPSLKVLLLYAEAEICELCFEVYEEIKKLAVQFSDREVIEFGGLNLFRNQHPDLKEENVPIVLVFRDGIQMHKLAPEEVPTLSLLIERQLKMSEEVEKDEL